MTANQRFRGKEEELASKYFALLNFSFEKWRFPNQESKQNISGNKEIIWREGGKKVFWKILVKHYYKTFASCKSSLRIPWQASKLCKNMKKNIAYSVFWRLWLGFQKAKFQVIPGPMLIFMAQRENIYSLLCPIKCWQVLGYFFGSLWTVQDLEY